MQNMCPEERCHTVAVVGIRHVVTDSAHLWRSIAHGNACAGGTQHPQVVGAVPKGNRVLRRDAQVPRECSRALPLSASTALSSRLLRNDDVTRTSGNAAVISARAVSRSAMSRKHSCTFCTG